ncbi:MAG TPA: DedA family protein [Chloroflexota bacterium]|jgi:membrane protein DedA with SNARE-associated domain
MDWWNEFGLAMASFLDRHGLLAAFVVLLVEEAGVPVPVPGDFLMLYLGVRAGEGWVPLWQAIVVMELATIVGATVLYTAARLGGRGLVYRYGRFIRLTPERLDNAETWLKQHGSRAVFLGRLLPGLRIVTAVACGVFEVPPRIFLPAMSLGALLYIVVYTLLGYYFGQPVLDLIEAIHLPFGLLGSLIPLAILVWWTVRARQGLGRRATRASVDDHEQHLRSGAVAGFLATIGSTLLLNVVINLAGNIAFNAPSTIVDRTVDRLAFAFAREVQPSLLFVVIPAYVAVGMLWGAVYGAWGEAMLPFQWDWLNGLVYAVLPLLTSLLVVMPLVGLGFFGVGSTGVVALIGETIRHMAYGVLLGLLYPVLRARRSVRVLPHTPEELAPEGAVT